MEKYEQEKAFIKSIDIRELYRLTESRERPLDILSEYKAWLIEQAKKDNLTFKECVQKVIDKGVKENGVLFIQSDELEEQAAEMYANQFIPVAPAEKWIEIKSYKDLPKNYSDVIVFGRFTKDCPKRVYEATFNPKNGKFYSDGILSKDINHWMPLPDAPGESNINP